MSESPSPLHISPNYFPSQLLLHLINCVASTQSYDNKAKYFTPSKIFVNFCIRSITDFKTFQKKLFF